MRIEPSEKFNGIPCSYVGTGCAFEDIKHQPFDFELPRGLKDDGYLSLDDANKYLRSKLHVKKKVYYKRGTRPILRDFL